MWHLIRSAMAALVLGAAATPAWATPAKPWSIDYASSMEGTSNVQQQRDGVSDFILRNSLEFSYYPVGDADNSALFRVQALNQRYRFNPEYDSTYLIGTALASRRMVDSLFGYGGYQVLYKQSTAPSDRSPTDTDLFAGAVNYTPLGASRLVFHGYQYDMLRAAVESAGYQGHSLYVTMRDATTDRWVNAASLRSQWRIFGLDTQMEWRNFASLESSYHLTDWWSLDAQVVFLTSTATRKEFSFVGFNYGVFTRFTL